MTLEPRKCRECGQVFQPRHGNHVYCSEVCSRKHYKSYYKKKGKYTDEEYRLIERKNFENLISFYHEQLLNIHRTGLRPENLNPYEFKNLDGYGLFNKVYRANKDSKKTRFITYELTDKALDELKTLGYLE